MKVFLIFFTYLLKLGQSDKSLQVEYNLKDETPADSFVGNLAESLRYDLRDSLVFVLTTSRKFRYFNDYFRVSHNGDLHTRRRIDRDNTNEICGPLNCCMLPVCTLQANIIANILSDTMLTSKFDLLPTRRRRLSETAEKQLQIELIIHISDVNDNAPQFLPSSLTVKDTSNMISRQPNVFHIFLREGELSSSETLPIAFDADSRPNGVVEYRLIQTANLLFPDSLPSLNISVSASALKHPRDDLSLKSDTMPILTPRLIHTRPLDFETPGDRELHALLLAVDGGDPPLTGTLSIVVNLLDVNDNSPVFEHQEEDLYLTVPENSTLKGEPIFVIRATDADSADNGKIAYMLSPLAGIEVARKFSVDASSGAVTIKQPLDYEIYSERHFVLPLIAKDYGSPQRSCTTSLFVNVRDVNDNVPSLVVQENVTIPEGELLTKPVIKFYIKDEDEASHGKVRCELDNSTEVHNNDSELIAGKRFLRLHGVSDTVFFVFLKHAMDFEQTPKASLILVCIDLADVSEGEYANREPPTKQLIRITVAVTDRNDNTPRFSEGKYFVKMVEHAPQGSLITTVHAEDADSGEFGTIVYSLGSVSMGQTLLTPLPPAQQMLRIDPTTGQIEVLSSAALDRELMEIIHVNVLAKDKGGLSASAELVIELTDINDMAPTLTSPKEFRLRENQRVDTIIGHMRLLDRDSGRNARIHLAPRIRQDNVFSKYIRLESDPKFHYVSWSNESFIQQDLIGDGEVRALLVSQMPVDRETYTAIFFEVLAYDEGDPMNTVSVTITIHVEDENDNSPVPIFPLPEAIIGYHPIINSNTPYGTIVAKLRAADADQGENGTVFFRIKPGTNGSELFSLNSSSGELATAWLSDLTMPGERPSRSDLTASNFGNKPTPGVYLLEVLLTDNGVPSNTFLNHFYVNVDLPELEVKEKREDVRFTGFQLDSIARSHGSTNYVLWAVALLLSLFVICTGTAVMFWIRICNKPKRMQSVKQYFSSPVEHNPLAGAEANTRINHPPPSECEIKGVLLDPPMSDFCTLPQEFEFSYGAYPATQAFSSPLCGSIKQRSHEALSMYTAKVPMHEADSPGTQLVHGDTTQNTILNTNYNSSYLTTTKGNAMPGNFFLDRSDNSYDTRTYGDFMSFDTFPNGYTISPMRYFQSPEPATKLRTSSEQNCQNFMGPSMDVVQLLRTSNFQWSPVPPTRSMINAHCSPREYCRPVYNQGSTAGGNHYCT